MNACRAGHVSVMEDVAYRLNNSNGLRLKRQERRTLLQTCSSERSRTRRTYMYSGSFISSFQLMNAKGGLSDSLARVGVV